MSTRPGVSFLPSPCVRDCRIDPYDKNSPYVPPACSGAERSVHACVCSCLDMYPDWGAILGTGDDVSAAGLVAAVINHDLDCYCDNADTYKATVSLIVGTYYFGWDESSLDALNRILAKAQETCPGDPHSRVEIYAAVPTTNLACVQGPSDWGDPAGTPILDASVFGDDPEPSATQAWSAPLVEKAGHEPIIDCAATALLQPSAFLVVFRTSCGMLVACPNRNPGGIVRSCPECGQECISITVSAEDSFSSECIDGETDCTVTFTIVCPGGCACLTGNVVVTFTLDGSSASTDPVFAACGSSITATTPAPFACDGDSGNWSFLITFTCESSDTPCAPGADCRGTPPCPKITEKNGTIALGGGIIP